MAKTVKGKRSGFGLEMKTFHGSRGTYIVFKLPNGSFHTFLETEAKDAAMDCGSGYERTAHTNSHWTKLWNEGPEPDVATD